MVNLKITPMVVNLQFFLSGSQLNLFGTLLRGKKQTSTYVTSPAPFVCFPCLPASAVVGSARGYIVINLASFAVCQRKGEDTEPLLTEIAALCMWPGLLSLPPKIRWFY